MTIESRSGPSHGSPNVNLFSSGGHNGRVCGPTRTTEMSRCGGGATPPPPKPKVPGPRYSSVCNEATPTHTGLRSWFNTHVDLRSGVSDNLITKRQTKYCNTKLSKTYKSHSDILISPGVDNSTFINQFKRNKHCLKDTYQSTTNAQPICYAKQLKLYDSGSCVKCMPLNEIFFGSFYTCAKCERSHQFWTF